MKWRKRGRSVPLSDAFAISFYSSISIYILVFRVYINIVGSGESEFFPVEILTTASIISAIIFIYQIYKKDILKIGKRNILYPCLLVTFFTYYLAENNWLLGRDDLTGVVAFGVITGLIFIITLINIYKINLKAGIIFGLGIIFLVIGTIVDASVDGFIPLGVGIGQAGLVEEVFELYASLFFLHSLVLLYFYSNTQDQLMVQNRRALAKTFMGTLVLSYANSLLLYDRQDPVPIQRILSGLLIVAFTLSVIYISFILKNPLQNSDVIDEKNYTLLKRG
jgi:hypothetical protein